MRVATAHLTAGDLLRDNQSCGPVRSVTNETGIVDRLTVTFVDGCRTLFYPYLLHEISNPQREESR